MWQVYILQSIKDGKYYIGSTNDLTRRMKEHALGHCKSTRNRRPLKIAYTEILKNLPEARTRELQIKSYKGGEAFKKLVKIT